MLSLGIAPVSKEAQEANSQAQGFWWKHVLPCWLAGRSDELKLYTRGEEEAGWDPVGEPQHRLQAPEQGCASPENMVLDLENSSGMGRALVEPGVPTLSRGPGSGTCGAGHTQRSFRTERNTSRGTPLCRATGLLEVNRGLRPDPQSSVHMEAPLRLSAAASQLLSGGPSGGENLPGVPGSRQGEWPAVCT